MLVALLASHASSNRTAATSKRLRSRAFSSASLSKSIPILTTQQKYIDPWLGFQLLSYSLLQSLPETIETAWPAPLCPPRFERCRTAQSCGLLGKRFQVELQVEDPFCCLWKQRSCYATHFPSCQIST